MVIFAKTWLSGLGHDQSNSWENIVLDWIEANWTLPDPPKYNAVTAKYGVLFGMDYFGQWDYVGSTKIREGDGMSSNLMSLGGRHDKNIVDVTFTFSVRKYSAQQGDELPVQVTYVTDFIEDLIDRNPRALQNQGIRYMELVGGMKNGEVEIYGQQIYQIEFIIRCHISRINLE